MSGSRICPKSPLPVRPAYHITGGGRFCLCEKGGKGRFYLRADAMTTIRPALAALRATQPVLSALGGR